MTSVVKQPISEWDALQTWAKQSEPGFLRVESERLTLTNRPTWLGRVWEALRSFFGFSTLESVARRAIALATKACSPSNSQKDAFEILAKKIEKFNSRPQWQHLTKIPSEIFSQIVSLSKDKTQPRSDKSSHKLEAQKPLPKKLPIHKKAPPSNQEVPVKKKALPARKKAPPASPKKAQPEEVSEKDSSLLCAGICNIGANKRTLNRCCLNAALKLLYATKSFREELASAPQSEMKRALLALFQKLYSSKKALSLDDEAMEEIVRLLEEDFPGLRKREQLDAQELLKKIIDKTLGENYLFIEERKNKDPVPFSFSGKKEDTVFLSFPFLNRPEISSGAVCIVPLPTKLKHFNLQDHFAQEGREEEFEITCDQTTMRTKDDVEGSLTNNDLDQFKTKTGKETTYHSRYFIRTDPPPRSLFVQLNGRYGGGTRGKRNFPIDIPYDLNVYQSDDERTPIKYQLRAVTLLQGNSPTSGHYYTYVPNPKSPIDSNFGLPTEWISHDDSSIQTVTLKRIRSILEQCSYLFSYERV